MPPVPYSQTREHLIHLLTEAAELEHNILCSYLYAAFSLKSGVEEGLSAREAEMVAQWRRVVLNVAVEEMGHLRAKALEGSISEERQDRKVRPDRRLISASQCWRTQAYASSRVAKISRFPARQLNPASTNRSLEAREFRSSLNLKLALLDGGLVSPTWLLYA